jgi:hypothetical protein
MTTKKLYSLSMINNVLDVFLSKNLINEKILKKLKLNLSKLESNNEDNLYSIVSAMLMANYSINKVITEKKGKKTFINIIANRRLDQLPAYKDTRLCSVNNNLFITLNISVNTDSVTGSFEINQFANNETPIIVSFHSLSFDKINNINEIKKQEFRLSSIWSYAHQTYAYD